MLVLAAMLPQSPRTLAHDAVGAVPVLTHPVTMAIDPSCADRHGKPGISFVAGRGPAGIPRPDACHQTVHKRAMTSRFHFDKVAVCQKVRRRRRRRRSLLLPGQLVCCRG
jgi:hypothetical protein